MILACPRSKIHSVCIFDVDLVSTVPLLPCQHHPFSTKHRLQAFETEGIGSHQGASPVIGKNDSALRGECGGIVGCRVIGHVQHRILQEPKNP